MSVSSESSYVSNIMRDDLNEILHSAFKITPASHTFAFAMLRTMWGRCRSKFSIIGGIHQNHIADPLHFSVSVDIADGWIIYIHINGFYKNKFIIQNMTTQTKYYDTNVVETVAVYETY